MDEMTYSKEIRNIAIEALGADANEIPLSELTSIIEQSASIAN